MPLNSVDHYGRSDPVGLWFSHMAYHACPHGAGKDIYNYLYYATTHVVSNHAVYQT